MGDEIAESAELRCTYFYVCDIVRCSLKAKGAEDMISVVKKVSSLGEMSPTGKFEVWRIKNTHHSSVDARDIVAGYRDVKLIGRFTAKAPTSSGTPACMLAEV